MTDDQMRREYEDSACSTSAMARRLGMNENSLIRAMKRRLPDLFDANLQSSLKYRDLIAKNKSVKPLAVRKIEHEEIQAKIKQRRYF